MDLRKKLGAFLVLLAALAYSGLPGFAQDRQLQIAPVAKPPAGERRLALVIGNSNYKTAPLKNPVNDARAIGKALAATGFQVTVVEDASQVTMRRAMRAFGDELMNGGVGLFYFAGHGMQVKGKNYLIPVNADIEREDEVEDGAVDANFLLSKMDSAKNALNVVILDACRNNPFARSFRSASQGLAQMDAPSGTLIAFATAPGSVAADGDGDNGLYTKHLLAHLAKPGLAIEQLFKEVRIGVTRETKDRQVPWESSSLKGNFFFVPGETQISAEEQRRQIEKQVGERVAAERAEVQRQMQKVIQEMLAKQKAELEEEMKRRQGGAAAAAPVAPAAPAHDPRQMELAFWESIKNSSNPEDFRAYLQQFPQGTFVALARSRATPAAPAPVTVAAAPVAAPAPAPLPALKPAEAAKPAAIASAPAEAPRPAPVQVASIAPSTALAGMGIDNPRFPKIGDHWEYSFTNLSTRQQSRATIAVTAVSEDGIIESAKAFGESAARVYGPGPHLEFTRSLLNFQPYLLAFGEPKPGQTWRGLHALNSGPCMNPGTICSFDAKVVGREKVTTPAGTFDTVKVVVDLTAQIQANRIWREFTYWYAESAKRVVKSSNRLRSGNAQQPDYDVELVSYKLN